MPLYYCVDVILLKFTFAVIVLDNTIVLLKLVKSNMLLLLAKEKWERRIRSFLLPLEITNLSIDTIAQIRIDSFFLSFSE